MIFEIWSAIGFNFWICATNGKEISSCLLLRKHILFKKRISNHNEKQSGECAFGSLGAHVLARCLAFINEWLTMTFAT